MVSNWSKVRLEEVTEITMGQSPRSTDCNENGEGLPFFQGNAEFGYMHPYPNRFCTKPKKTADKGDLLISVRAPVGDVNIVSEKSAIGRGVSAIRALEINRTFLFYYLQFFKPNWVRFQQGSTFTAINKTDVSNLLVPNPVLKEQQKIAAILSSVDEAIEKTEQIIEQTEQVKKGLMQELLTSGIGHTEFKKSRIGKIPKGWQVTSIGNIGDIITGNTPKTSENENYGDDFSWVSPIDLGNTKYIRETKTKLSYLGFEKTKKLPMGAILVTCIGSTIGKIGIASRELSTNQQINSIICDKNVVCNEYLYYALKYNFRLYKNFISNQAVPIINKSTFSSFPIQLPSIDEQIKIANSLSQIDDKIEKENNKYEQLLNLKQGLMQQLLTGKVRVPINDDEEVIET